MTLGQLLIYLIRISALAAGLTAFIMQLEPDREFTPATLKFDGSGNATYASLRLRVGKKSYPILFADEKVLDFLQQARGDGRCIASAWGRDRRDEAGRRRGVLAESIFRSLG